MALPTDESLLNDILIKILNENKLFSFDRSMFNYMFERRDIWNFLLKILIPKKYIIDDIISLDYKIETREEFLNRDYFEFTFNSKRLSDIFMYFIYERNI